MKGGTNDAIAKLDRVIRLYPDYVPAVSSRGVLYARLGKDVAALKDAQAALVLAKGAPATLFQVAGIYALCSSRDEKHRDRSIQLLASALRGGYGHDLLAIDDDLKPLHADKRYIALVHAAKTVQTEGKSR